MTMIRTCEIRTIYVMFLLITHHAEEPKLIKLNIMEEKQYNTSLALQNFFEILNLPKHSGVPNLIIQYLCVYWLAGSGVLTKG